MNAWRASTALLLLTLGVLAGWASGQVRPPPPGGTGVPPVVPGPTPLVPAHGVTDPPTPTVHVRIRVPARAEPGKELTYRLTVHNDSAAAAHHVLLRHTLPEGVRLVRADPKPTADTADTPPKEEKNPPRELHWQLGTLDPHTRKEITVVVLPKGDGDLTSCARVRFEHGQCVRTRIGRATLQVGLTGPRSAPLFDAVAFRIVVTNHGDAPARDVVVTNQLPDGMTYLNSKPSTGGDNPLTWKLGTLAPGQTRTIEYDVSARRVGAFTSRAVVTASPGKRQLAQHTVEVAEPALEVFHTGPARRLVGRSAVYRVTVANPTRVPVKKVRIVYPLYRDDRVRKAIAFVRASAGGRLAGRDIVWDIPSLEPGQRRVVELEVRAREAGTFGNVVRVQALPPVAEQKVKGPATVFEAPAGLAVEIAKGQDPVRVGDEAAFTLRALNPGTGVASQVALTVEVPEGHEVVLARGPTAVRQEKGRITFAPLPVLQPGAEAVYLLRLRAHKPGEAKLRADLTSRQMGTPARAEETVTVRAKR
jgi:uncharacterized repeat protein (TIGR01451 family)